MHVPAGSGGGTKRGVGILRWLAGEPYRLFFVSGAVWSVAGVLLWPLFYQGRLSYYPSIVHARLMIEGFAGAFVAGFLGTAGPRMTEAPPLTVGELFWLFALHEACAVSHLRLHSVQGDWLFIVLLGSLLVSLSVRAMPSGRTAPPQLVLALTGLVCGMAGAAMLALPDVVTDGSLQRMAALLLYQGLLLPPVLGIGAFLFPRMLGGDFGGPVTPQGIRRERLWSGVAGILIVVSFAVEAWGWPVSGCLLRAVTGLVYLGIRVPWRKRPGDSVRGSLANGLPWSLITGSSGLALAGFVAYPQRISVEHLLYVGGFGLLMLIVASRVLFGHGGAAGQVQNRSWTVRILVTLGILTAWTRAIPGILPQLTQSHHQYAALSWSILAILWLGWHSRRFVTRDPG